MPPHNQSLFLFAIDIFFITSQYLTMTFSKYGGIMYNRVGLNNLLAGCWRILKSGVWWWSLSRHRYNLQKNRPEQSGLLRHDVLLSDSPMVRVMPSRVLLQPKWGFCYMRGVLKQLNCKAVHEIGNLPAFDNFQSDCWGVGMNCFVFLNPGGQND